MVLVSATLPHEILEMTRKFMTDPIRILVKRYRNLKFIREREREKNSHGSIIMRFPQWWADPWGHQAVLCCHREGGVEVWHALWPLRHSDHHTGGHLLQHEEKGGVADREDERGKLHRLLHARRHAAEGERRHHEGIQGSRQVRKKKNINIKFCFSE